MQGKKLKGEGILVKDKREKNGKGTTLVRNLVAQSEVASDPNTRVRAITSYFWHNKIVSL